MILLELQVKQLQQQQAPKEQQPDVAVAKAAEVDLSLLDRPHWGPNNIVDLQQKWVQSLQRIKECCTAEPSQPQSA